MDLARRLAVLAGGLLLVVAATLALLPLQAPGVASCGSALLPRSFAGTVEAQPVPNPTVPRRPTTTTRPFDPSSPLERARRASGIEPTTTTRPTVTTLSLEQRTELGEERAERVEAAGQRACAAPIDERRKLAVLLAVPGLALAAGGWLLLDPRRHAP